MNKRLKMKITFIVLTKILVKQKAGNSLKKNKLISDKYSLTFFTLWREARNDAR